MLRNAIADIEAARAAKEKGRLELELRHAKNKEEQRQKKARLDREQRIKEQEEAERQRQFDASPEGQKLIAENKQKLYESLVDIAGVSDKVARTLMDQFPTVQKINQSTAEQLTDIPGVGLSVAKAIKARLG